MKKAIVAAVTGILFVTITSCGGGGHVCDAYNKADYTKHKTEQTKKIQLDIRKN